MEKRIILIEENRKFKANEDIKKGDIIIIEQSDGELVKTKAECNVPTGTIIYYTREIEFTDYKIEEFCFEIDEDEDGCLSLSIYTDVPREEVKFELECSRLNTYDIEIENTLSNLPYLRLGIGEEFCMELPYLIITKIIKEDIKELWNNLPREVQYEYYALYRNIPTMDIINKLSEESRFHLLGTVYRNICVDILRDLNLVFSGMNIKGLIEKLDSVPRVNASQEIRQEMIENCIFDIQDGDSFNFKYKSV